MTDRRTEKQPQRVLAEHLTGVLADTYLLYHTTQSCHWNVIGNRFKPLHDMFEEQYRELAEAIDTIAERIRILGFYTPGTLADYAQLGSIEQPEQLRSPEEMLERLIASHEAVNARIQQAIPAANRASDEATLDLLVERLRVHEKTGWMLKSQAGHESAHLDVGKTQLRQTPARPKLARAGTA